MMSTTVSSTHLPPLGAHERGEIVRELEKQLWMTRAQLQGGA